MSDKEAKLAAARKRAEALKAKKAKKNDAEKGEEPESTAAGEADSSEAVEDIGKDESTAETHDFQKEIDRLQGLLDESTSQQESLRKDLQEAHKQTKELEKDLKTRITELESSLARREDQTQALELDLANLRKEHETQTSELVEVKKQHEQSQKKLSAAESKPNLQDELDKLKAQLDSAQKSQHQGTETLEKTKQERTIAVDRSKELEKQLQEALTKQSTSDEAVSPRESEIQSKADTLLSENQNLLAQLSELRTHLISVQDEKFALVESVERLQKEVKEAKASKASHKNSSDVPRPRISRDFERTVSMQDVSLDERVPSEKRNPAEPPAELRSNIQIDLTSWYDKHAGEVIEV